VTTMVRLAVADLFPDRAQARIADTDVPSLT
jgi:hypothetical protein